MVKKTLRICLFLLLILLMACDEDFYDTSCENCFEEKPQYGLLEVKVSQNLENPYVLIDIYSRKGSVKTYFLADTLASAMKEYWVPVGANYIVEASYKKGNKTVIAVDEDKVDIIYDGSSCDAPCYRPNDGRVDCRLLIK